MTLKRAMDPADHPSMTGARSLYDERGYTLVELLVAAFVLVVGMAGAFTLLNGANRATVTNNARMGANNLARELLEDARSVDYDQLTPSGIMPVLQAKAGVTGNPTPWIVARRGIKFTVTTNVCTFDDPKDNIAATPPANVCTPQAPVPASATGLDPEAQPDDFRRVTVTVDWNTGNGNRSYKQVSLINNPSGGLGPRITQFDPPYKQAGGDPAQLTSDVDRERSRPRPRRPAPCAGTATARRTGPATRPAARRRGGPTGQLGTAPRRQGPADRQLVDHPVRPGHHGARRHLHGHRPGVRRPRHRRRLARRRAAGQPLAGRSPSRASTSA